MLWAVIQCWLVILFIENALDGRIHSNQIQLVHYLEIVVTILLGYRWLNEMMKQRKTWRKKRRKSNARIYYHLSDLYSVLWCSLHRSILSVNLKVICKKQLIVSSVRQKSHSTSPFNSLTRPSIQFQDRRETASCKEIEDSQRCEINK